MSNPPVVTFPGLEVGPVWIRQGANPVGCVVYWWPVLNAEQRSEIWSVLIPAARLEVLSLVELATTNFETELRTSRRWQYRIANPPS